MRCALTKRVCVRVCVCVCVCACLCAPPYRKVAVLIHGPQPRRPAQQRGGEGPDGHPAVGVMIHVCVALVHSIDDAIVRLNRIRSFAHSLDFDAAQTEMYETRGVHVRSVIHRWRIVYQHVA